MNGRFSPTFKSYSSMMQFKLSLTTLATFITAAVAVPSVSTCTPHLSDDSDIDTQAGVPVKLVSRDEMTNWLKTTDANLTFVGEPIPGVNAPEGLTSRDAQNTMVTYCTTRNDNVCGGTCAVYNGGPTCINAPGTSCISATNNVGFCDRSGYVRHIGRFSNHATVADKCL